MQEENDNRLNHFHMFGIMLSLWITYSSITVKGSLAIALESSSQSPTV